MTAHTAAPYGLTELNKESRMGATGSDTAAREVRCIDLSDFARRKAQITEELWAAVVEVGFFQVRHHGIDLAHVQDAFDRTASFFALSDEIKARHPLKKALNSGWESRAQVRPSTGTADQKESYQITRPHMAGLWPAEEELPGFHDAMLAFESRCHALAMQILSCFAVKLGFDAEFFTRAHDPATPAYQSTLRLLHYFAVDPAQQAHLGLWRAGAHTDFNCLTLLFQRRGQGGLQVCPGKEMDAQAWSTVVPADDVITCNIGDMLMRWSDDQLPSNFHRVRNPLPDEYQGSRYSIAFFAQANKDQVIEGPGHKYPPITAGDYIQQRINANFKAY